MDFIDVFHGECATKISDSFLAIPLEFYDFRELGVYLGVIKFGLIRDSHNNRKFSICILLIRIFLLNNLTRFTFLNQVHEFLSL